MFKGTNTITLNRATMCDLMQKALNDRVYSGSHLVVTGISQRTEHACPVFDITVEEPKPDPTPRPEKSNG